jgi:seryl-tRNA synthetase
MHDIKIIRQDAQRFDLEMEKRGLAACSNQVIYIDEEKRAVTKRLQNLQGRRNQVSKTIGVKKQEESETNTLMLEVASIKSEIQQLEKKEKELGEELSLLLSGLPNVLDSEVPQGLTEDENIEIKKSGNIVKFAFKAKDHLELGEALGGMDFASAAKVSGSRFVFLKNSLARLERALANFMLDHQVNKYGYTEISPPLIVNDQALYGTGQLPKFSDQQFKTTEGFWLIPTSEVPLTNLVAGKVLDEDQLPLRYTAYTPCFRSEAGASGKDTRGMIRVHQFGKVEMVSIVNPDDSSTEHERMTECAEDILSLLELPYRTVLLCSGDTGFSAKKTYDIEAWLPGQENGSGRYREISSCSTCGSFQARRMRARFRRKGSKNTEFVHTLNGSGLAVGRTIIALLENHQQKDGSISVPSVLQPYMNGVEIISID